MTTQNATGIDDATRRELADELLAIRCQLGELGAMDALVERWHRSLWGYVRSLAPDDDAAAEAVQDVWLRVLRAISGLRDPARLRPWLFGIARRVMMDRLRKEYAEPERVEIDLADIAGVNDVDDRAEDLGQMRDALATMPLTEREVLGSSTSKSGRSRRWPRCWPCPAERSSAPIPCAADAASCAHRKGDARMIETHSPAPGRDTPKPSVDEIRTLVAAELGRASGPRHVALLLGALSATGLIVALLATEPALPPRAKIAFTVMVAIGLSWSTFAAWVLARRGVLFGKERLIAARQRSSSPRCSRLGHGAWADGARLGVPGPVR